MPSTMIHLVVAYSIRRTLCITCDGEFYLGAIAPDAVNLNGKADKELRYKAHLRSTDFSEWIKNVCDYAKNHRDLFISHRDYFSGFLTHILTDIAWDQVSQPLLFERMSNKGVPEYDLNIKKWDELFFYDNIAVKSDIWKNSIRPELMLAKADCSLTVSADEVNRARDFVTGEKFIATDIKPFGLVTDNMIKKAIQKVLELFESIKVALLVENTKTDA